MSEEKAVKVIKAKKSVPLKEFMAKMYPMKVKKDDDIIEISRPDMAGCSVEGLSPYGSYAKILIDKKKEVIKVWSLEPDKEDPDKMIVNGVDFK